MPATATIRDVELVSVGTWAASTGVTKVTRADLESMLAAHADGLVDNAPVKLGHESTLNDGLGDGAPAYGWVVPTRIATNANGLETLYGDLVGMPAKLAEVAPTAYRRRSVEIAWGVKTPKGDTYAAALVGIALLGASPPAVKGLDDVLALYSAEPQVERVSAVELVDGLEDQPVAVAMLAAARNLGSTVEQIDALAAAAGARDTADVPPPVEDPNNDDPDPTDNGTTADGRNTMTDEELRAALKLEADADVNAALSGLLAERTTDPEPTTDPAPAEPTTDPAPATDPAPTTDPAPATQDQPVAALSAADVAEFGRLAQESRDRRRKDALDGAIRAGRISPAERAHFAAAMDRDEAGTITLLGAMTPRFAVTEFGDDSAPQTNLSADQAAAYDSFEADVFPELALVRQQPQA